MLRPSKHSHPDKTMMYLAVVLLKHMRGNQVSTFTDLRKLAEKRVTGGEILFLPALNFLYLLGLIEYLPKIDAIEFVGFNEVI